MREAMKKLQDSHKKMGYQLSSKKNLLNAFESNKKHFETANAAIVSDLRLRGILVDTHAANYEKLEIREEILLRRIDELESRIQDNSRFAIIENYGAGPYQVEVTLTSMSHERIPTREPIVFELASLNTMPHSVHHFLRMLTQGVWIGMTFTPHRSVHHRIHASPVDIDTLQRVDWKFKDAKVASLAFNEQSSDFSCGPYSVGFADPRGHPDFYVNGAFVPKKHAQDSCFAKVITGEKVIDSIIDRQRTIFGIENIRLLPREEMIAP